MCTRRNPCWTAKVNSGGHSVGMWSCPSTARHCCTRCLAPVPNLLSPTSVSAVYWPGMEEIGIYVDICEIALDLLESFGWCTHHRSDPFDFQSFWWFTEVIPSYSIWLHKLEPGGIIPKYWGLLGEGGLAGTWQVTNSPSSYHTGASLKLYHWRQ